MRKRSIAAVIKRQIVLLFLFSIIIFFAGFYGLKRIPPVYQARATVKVERRGAEIEELDQLKEESSVLIGNMIQKLKSNTLLRKALLRLERDYPIESPEFNRIKKNLQAQKIASSSVIEVKLRYSSAQETARIVNTLLEILMEENGNERRAEVESIKKYIYEKLQETQSEKRRLAGQMKTPVSSIRPSATSLSKKERLQEVEGDIRYTNNKISHLLTQLHEYERRELKKALTPDNQVFSKRRPEFELQEKRLVDELLKNGWDSPAVKSLMTELWRQKTKMVQELQKHFSPKIPGPQNIIDELFVFYVKLYDLEIRRQQLRLAGGAVANDGERTLSEEQNVFEALNALESRLIKKLVELESIDDLTLTEISWVDRATPPYQAFFPTPEIILALSLLAVFFTCFISISIGYYRDGRDRGDSSFGSASDELNAIINKYDQS